MAMRVPPSAKRAAVQPHQRGQGAQVGDEALGAVDRPGDIGRGKEHVGDVFAQRERGQDAGLAVAQGVDEAEGDVGEAQPGQVSTGAQGGILPGPGAPRPAKPAAAGSHLRTTKIATMTTIAPLSTRRPPQAKRAQAQQQD